MMNRYEESIDNTRMLSSIEIQRICEEYVSDRNSNYIPGWAYSCFLPLAYCVEKLLPIEGIACLSADVHLDFRNIIVERLAYLGRSVCMKLILDREKTFSGEQYDDGREGICRYMIFRGYSLIAKKYPVLAHLIDVSIEEFLYLNTFFLENLKRDWEEINQFCGNPAKVTGIFQEMKELHSNDKNIHILTFDNGRKLVYKQENMQLSLAWSTWVQKLNRDFEFELSVPQQIVKQSYIWQEYISQESIENLVEAADYFKRAGELLCVLYVGNANDIQSENLIAHGSSPVLIDFETIINGSSSNDSGSVKSTYFLPGCQSERYVKKDFAAMAFEEGKSSLPVWSGRTCSAQSYISEFESGFVNAYRKIAANKDALCPDNYFRKAVFRYVLRPTWLYVWILNQGLLVRNLTSWEAFEKSLFHKQLWAEERQQLMQGYLPHFQQTWTGKDLYMRDQVVKENFFAESPATVIQHRRQQMNELDMERQVQDIRGCFASGSGAV